VPPLRHVLAEMNSGKFGETETLLLNARSIIAFYEKVIKVKADVAAYLIKCFPSV
jgi:hypothetical protein